MSSIERQIEEFFLLATLYDAEKECLKAEYASHGIIDIEDWKEKMDHALDWLHEHSSIALLNLANLRKKWPASCEALEEILHNHTSIY